MELTRKGTSSRSSHGSSPLKIIEGDCSEHTEEKVERDQPLDCATMRQERSPQKISLNQLVARALDPINGSCNRLPYARQKGREKILVWKIFEDSKFPKIENFIFPLITPIEVTIELVFYGTPLHSDMEFNLE